jgi:hypothetical protein
VKKPGWLVEDHGATIQTPVVVGSATSSKRGTVVA